MQIILMEKVVNLGSLGDVVNVKNGYARNFLIPQGKAKRATQLQDAYQVEGTPALGVAGRFYISGQGPRTLAVADALIAELRKT